MLRINVTLDHATFATIETLCRRYGNTGSVSSVVRRAVALLAERWRKLEDQPIVRAREIQIFNAHAAPTRRGNRPGRTLEGRRRGQV